MIDAQTSMVEISHLEKRFGAEDAVDNVNLSVAKGEVVTLLGPSGCGKTTTLRCIAGLERLDAGEISIGQTIVVSADKNIFLDPEKREIGMVFQSYAVWPHMTVFDNVAYGLRVRGIRSSELKKKTSYIPGPKEFSRGGGQSIASILNQMEPDAAAQYLDQIAAYDPDLLSEVYIHFLAFEDLLEMPAHLMNIFWRNPDLDIEGIDSAHKLSIISLTLSLSAFNSFSSIILFKITPIVTLLRASSRKDSWGKMSSFNLFVS